jgi:threonine dehydrogenase-like Zn-dependent dehydrogenase
LRKVPLARGLWLEAPFGEFGGALSDFMHVPFADHMLVRLPEGLDPVAVASAADNIPDGWRAVAPHLKVRPGANVLVVGGMAQSVGLYAAGAAVSLGAGRVLYLDDDATRRAAAERLGATAEPLALAERREQAKANRGSMHPAAGGLEQFEITVDASGNLRAPSGRIVPGRRRPNHGRTDCSDGMLAYGSADPTDATDPRLLYWSFAISTPRWRDWH